MRCRADLKAIEKLDEKDRHLERKKIAEREAKDLDELARSQFSGNLHPHG
jgi:flagellar biosynthesis chaperone FliJ